MKKVFLEISQNAGACSFIKKDTLAQVFPCEFCEISKNTLFYRIPLVAASVFTTGVVLVYFNSFCCHAETI